LRLNSYNAALVASEMGKLMTRNSSIVANLERSKRHYHSWVVNETLEDYSLRYAPKYFRRWPEFTIAALGGISYLADLPLIA